MMASYQERASAWLLDAVWACLPLIVASPLLVPLALSQEPVDNFASQSVGFMLAGMGLAVFVVRGLWFGVREGATWGLQKRGLQILAANGERADGKRVAARSLIGPVVWATLLLSGLEGLLLLWPAFALLSPDGRGVSDTLLGLRLSPREKEE